MADWFRLYGYTPSAAIVGFSDDTTMTPAARHLLYINRPKEAAKADFASFCPSKTEQTIILGCYHPVQRGIAVLKVDDSRLDGIEEVTTAHEMLHAAYDRLSAADKASVDSQLQDFYDHGLTDSRVKETLQSYPAEDRVNEMHSILGTEVAQLPAGLETYYKRYFTDRSKVAAYAARYSEAFTSRKQAVNQYDAQLKQWNEQIEQNTAQLDDMRSQLDQLQQNLQQSRAAGDISSYNKAVPEYNAEVDAYNQLAQATRSLITQYNETVKARNAVALEERDLQQAISSKVPAAQ